MTKAAENKYAPRKMSAASISELWKQIWVTPNLLSISRIIFIPVVVYFIAEHKNFAAVISMGIIWLTDYIDGFIARKFNKHTELGLLLDPISDKITSAVVFLSLVIWRDYPIWVLLMIIGRDTIILSAGYYLLKRGQLARSNEFGRKTTVLLCIIILLFLLNFEKIVYILNYVLILFVICTLISYIKIFCKTIREIPPKSE
jgi:CDP-diacylglycerol--glycerol-3-phosphate 3-phosphatidyltransferase